MVHWYSVVCDWNFYNLYGKLFLDIYIKIRRCGNMFSNEKNIQMDLMHDNLNWNLKK